MKKTKLAKQGWTCTTGHPEEEEDWDLEPLLGERPHSQPEHAESSYKHEPVASSPTSWP